MPDVQIVDVFERRHLWRMDTNETTAAENEHRTNAVEHRVTAQTASEVDR